ncbi:hypothetical protein Tsubulata_018293 [Turnera subulata]|uniref:Shikimate dehydrogenase substrate binding N-terminal domain-containing protein n=1 Tax=Turnera subulata TaxID=218843 RepID=A0A9Q0G748_9ROSI|nr:hypothetical protein Tsubulata_018293 [Turnera subulata]
MEDGTREIRNNTTLICVPIMADSVDDMLVAMARAKSSGADLVEIRLDSLNRFTPREDLKTLVKSSPLPTLFTYRPKWEGGQYDGDDHHRLDVLRLAVEFGADYVDVELQVACRFIDSVRGWKPANCRVIVSSRNYQNTPSVEELGNLVAMIQATGADIVKIATTALDITDVARIFRITVHSQVPIIGIVMGERGLISRILCAKFGGYLTFGSLESGVVSAPGQPTIKDLLNLYNFRQIGPDTKVYGVCGKPIGHSKSPLLYNEAFTSASFNGVYVHLLVDDIAKFLQTYSSTDFEGFSVGIPHKEAAVKCCDEVDPVAKSIGAVNCIVRRQSDGKLFGLNTDYFGAISAIEDGLRGSQDVSDKVGSPLAGKLFVVIGAGGAGKALAYGAKGKGARIRAKKLAGIVGGDATSLADLENFHPEDGMILANTTSVGMQPKVDETPIAKSPSSSAVAVEAMGGGVIRRNPTLICAPIMGDSVDEMAVNMTKAKTAGADLVEIRLDSLKSFTPRADLKTLINRSPLPTLFTYRPAWEGGQYDGDEPTRLDALRLAIESGADYVDVELQVAREFIDSIRASKPASCRVIVSSHNYQSTPSVEELGNLVARIQSTGADIVKIATTAVDITDVARIFQITVHSQVPIIGLVMGERGLISRILCAKFGGYLTFGTLESGVVSAPGQPTIKDLLDLYNFRLIGPDTKVYGIIGKPVGHSKSPILYNEAFKSVDFNGVFVHLLVDDLAKFFHTYSSVDFAGFSCTIPHKETAVNCCDEVDPVAKVLLTASSGDRVMGSSQNGSNTVGSPLAGKLFVVIGAGGAGKALAYGAKEKGARRAKEIAVAVGGDAISLADLENFLPEDGMVLANTTSIGMQPKVDETPISKNLQSKYC